MPNDDDDMYFLTLLTIYMIQINQNIYNNYNHKERVRTSGIGLRPSGLKWTKYDKLVVEIRLVQDNDKQRI